MQIKSLTVPFAAAASVLAAAGPVLAQQRGDYGPWHMWGGGWGGMFLGPIMMILFVAAVVVLAVLAVRWLSGGGHGAAPRAPSERSALDILKERYARGEIDSQEYEERRRVLGE